MFDFTYAPAPVRVVFAAGARRRAHAELEALGVERALVLSTPHQAEQARRFADSLGDRAIDLFDQAAMHTPIDVTATAPSAVESVRADGLVAYGGGSTIGLGKAIALRTDLPQVVLPTTFAGSEMTPILGQTAGGVKTTQTDPKIQPEVVIYDPELIATLPAAMAGPSGMNALAHAVEALYAENANPITSLMAEESIRALGRALPLIVNEATSSEDAAEARAAALYGAWLAGTCLGSVGMAVHHKICHTLGGSFDLPHADIHCLMIPYSAAYNRDAAPAAMARVARALNAADGPSALFDLMHKVGRIKSLAELGLSETDLDKAAEIAVQKPYYNPRPITRNGIRDMLQQAWEGDAP